MGNKKGSAGLIVTIVTLVTAGVVLLLPITFGVGTVGELWPLIFTAFFAALAYTTFTKELFAFLSVLFFFWFLSNADIAGFGRTWPVLLLVLAGLVYVGYVRNKKRKKGEQAEQTE